MARRDAVARTREASCAEIAGTAKDADFKFSFTVQGYTLTYTGTVEGDAMSGEIEVAGPYGKFTGKRSSPR
jgi:hypothetical protein